MPIFLSACTIVKDWSARKARSFVLTFEGKLEGERERITSVQDRALTELERKPAVAGSGS